MRCLPMLLSLAMFTGCGDASDAAPSDASDTTDAAPAETEAAPPETIDTAPADDVPTGDSDADPTPGTDALEETDATSGPEETLPRTDTADTTLAGDDTLDPAGDADLDAEVVALPCPVITIAEGHTFAPPLTLHLSSAASTGAPVTVRWTLVSTPAGLLEPLSPQANAREVTLEAALAGVYTFRLEAFDKLGQSGCEPAELTVRATPSSPVHLELLWDDNILDPSMSTGADLDLHVFHPDAIGLDVDGDGSGDGWFDPVLDCAWHNPAPAWPAADGAPNPAPRLLRRDDAGHGPEVIAIADPTPGLAYVAGFHVYGNPDDLYIQPTEIRIWIDGVLKNRPTFEVPVRAARLERVFTVEYPSGRLSFPFTTDGDFRPASPAK